MGRLSGIGAVAVASLVLVLVLAAAPSADAGPPPSPFPDVDPDSPFLPDIVWLVDREVTDGFPDGTFHPFESVSRGAMAAFLHRLAGSPPGPFADPGFTDVPPTHVFAGEVAWLAHADITTGRPDGSFGVNDPIDRGAMAAFLHRLAGAPPGPFADPGFDDVGPQHPFLHEIAWMKAAGVTGGYPDGSYRPFVPVPRQGMASFLRRLKVSHPLVVQIADGLKAPWDVAFVPDGSAFVTERDTGRLKRVSTGGQVTTVRTFDVHDGWESGLLGLEASPTIEEDHLLYLFISTDTDNRVVTLDHTAPLAPVTPIITGLPVGDIHNGGRIHFGPDGNLWVTGGDVNQGGRARDTSDLAGKVLRYTPDGDPAPGNPFGDTPVYTFGHRNVQGLAWHPSGKLFAPELGPTTKDEVNVLVPGGDYGWNVRLGVVNEPPFIDPVIVVQDPANLSPSGATIVPDTPNNAWAGDLLIAGMRGRRIMRADLDSSGEIVLPFGHHFVGWFGRIRHVEPAPDGSLWVLTTNAEERVGEPARPAVDRILRLIPPG